MSNPRARDQRTTIAWVLVFKFHFFMASRMLLAYSWLLVFRWTAHHVRCVLLLRNTKQFARVALVSQQWVDGFRRAQHSAYHSNKAQVDIQKYCITVVPSFVPSLFRSIMDYHKECITVCFCLYKVFIKGEWIPWYESNERCDLKECTIHGTIIIGNRIASLIKPSSVTPGLHCDSSTFLNAVRLSVFWGHFQGRILRFREVRARVRTSSEPSGTPPSPLFSFYWRYAVG